MTAGTKRILIQSPTGSGKTALTTDMLGTSASRGINSVFLVHRRELIKQSVKAFDQNEVFAGVVASGFPEEPHPRVQIGSIQTYIRRYQRLRQPTFFVWDECHHLAAKNWSKLFDAFPDAYHVGLTATPQRLDGRGLDQYFQVMVNGPSVSWLIEHDYLSKYRMYAPTGLSMEGVHTRMGDYVQREVTELVDKPKITGDAISHYRRLCPRAKNVVFCASVEHSKHVAAQFNAAGIRAEHVDGGTDSRLRDDAIARFQLGDTRVLCNVDLFGEGFDVPAIEAVTMLRPTQSLGLYLQQVGRGLRKSTGITTILDHVGNCERHGLPDEDRQWTLKGRDKKRRTHDDSGPAVKVCPKCYAAQFSGRPVCQFCGFEFEKQSRVIEEQEGELVEIDPARIRRERAAEQGAAQTFQDLVRVGVKRGFKNPNGWARHVFAARQRKKLAGGRR
jgi:superfamily II DNA or RNA helicase